MRRGVRFSPHPRNRADVYLPPRKDAAQAPRASPTVVFVTGGAWIIGHRAWGALLGRTLSALGVVVACLDYRNFPQGGVRDMVEDVEAGLEWVLGNVHLYGGDRHNVHVVGQSAGAHLVALALLRRAAVVEGRGAELGSLGAHRRDRARIGWTPRDLRTFIGLSGGYHLPVVAEHLHQRGLYKPLFDAIMSDGTGRSGCLEDFSPALLVAQEPFSPAGLGLRAGSRGARETTCRSPSPSLRWADIGAGGGGAAKTRPGRRRAGPGRLPLVLRPVSSVCPVCSSCMGRLTSPCPAPSP